MIFYSIQSTLIHLNVKSSISFTSSPFYHIIVVFFHTIHVFSCFFYQFFPYSPFFEISYLFFKITTLKIDRAPSLSSVYFTCYFLLPITLSIASLFSSAILYISSIILFKFSIILFESFIL